MSLHLPAQYVTDSTAAALADCLTKEVADSAAGAVWQGGHVGNLRVSLGESGLRVTGSLATFLYGDNVEPLHRRDVPQVIERLSSVVGADIALAEVRRVDVSATLLMRNAPAAYLPILGAAPRFTRVATAPTTVEYRRGKQGLLTMCFYDKAEELRSRRKENQMPAPYRMVGNCLRYELRLLKSPGRQLGLPNLTLGQLSDKGVFVKLAALWRNTYETITKTYQSMDFSQIKTVKDAEDFLLARLLIDSGGSKIDAYVEELKARGVYSNKQYYTNLKTSLKKRLERYSYKGDTDGESLGRELDLAVIDGVAHF